MQASYLRHVQLHADVLAHAPNVQHMQKTGHVKTTFEELFSFHKSIIQYFAKI